MNSGPARLRQALLAGLALAVLAGVGSLYTRPDFVVQMAEQLWACF